MACARFIKMGDLVMIDLGCAVEPLDAFEAMASASAL